MANKGVLLSHLPDKEYYRPEFMGTKEREEFEKWYEENYHNAFDNDFELISYCCSDVTILREACVKFKNLVKKVTTIPGADPAVAPPIEVFASTTIASSAMAIFQQLILSEIHKVTLIDETVVDAKLKAGVYTCLENGAVINPDYIVGTKFVKSSVPQPPSTYGYGRRNGPHSFKSIQWLEYLGSRVGRRFQHCRNGGEKKILNYYLDGWDEVTGECNFF